MNPNQNKYDILIVDDITDNIQLLLSFLTVAGYETAYALSGQEALDWVKDEVFDLILLDIMMPGMDGYEVCRRLKQNPATASIPVIFLTARTETDSLVQGFELGAVDYVTKPFDRDVLLARVKAHIELRRNRRKLELSLNVLKQKDKELTIKNEQLQELENIINKTPAMAFVLNAQPEISVKYVSAGAHNFGYNPDDLSKDIDAFSDIFHQDDLRKLREEVLTASSNKEIHLECRVYTAEGSLRWVQADIFKRCSDTGQVTHFEGMLVDITPLKQAQNDLSYQKSMLHAIMNSIPDMIFVKDKQGTYLEANTAYCNYLEIPREKIIGTTDKEHYSPEVFEQIRKYDHTLIENQQQLEIEYLLDFPGKGKRQHLIYVSPFINSQNQLAGLVGISRDVTDRIEMLAELQRSKELYATMARNLPDGLVMLFDKDAKIILAEGPELAKLGIKPSDLVGKTEKELNNAIKQNSPKLGSVTKALQGEFISSEYRYHNSCYYFYIIPIFDQQMQVEMAMLMGLNITKRRLAEEALRQSEQQLRQANATKDKFFSIVAHDLKNPFNSLLAISELLLMQLEEDEQIPKNDLHRFASMIFKSSNNAYNLLENLLQWSRAQMGTISWEPEELNLQQLTTEVHTLLDEPSKNKKIALLQHVPEDMQVFADKNMLATIVRNILTNALKFTPQGGSVTLAAAPYKNGVVKVTVRDTGVGMDEATVANLFKIDSTRSTNGTNDETGTGLGLLLCYEFVHKNKGKIWVESALGKGTTFNFTIPASNPKASTNSSKPAISD